MTLSQPPRALGKYRSGSPLGSSCALPGTPGGQEPPAFTSFSLCYIGLSHRGESQVCPSVLAFSGTLPQMRATLMRGEQREASGIAETQGPRFYAPILHHTPGLSGRGGCAGHAKVCSPTRTPCIGISSEHRHKLRGPVEGNSAHSHASETHCLSRVNPQTEAELLAQSRGRVCVGDIIHSLGPFCLLLSDF